VLGLTPGEAVWVRRRRYLVDGKPVMTAALGLGAGTPVIAVNRTAYDAAGGAVEFTEMVLDSGAYLLEYDFDA
jgi:GntR family transcriptional regulator